jgi:hypothetical protein
MFKIADGGTWYPEAGTRNFEFAIAIPQLEGSTSAIAILQLFKINVAPQPQLRSRNFFWSPQLESAIFCILLAVE